jgi:hypothetical protein
MVQSGAAEDLALEEQIQVVLGHKLTQDILEGHLVAVVQDLVVQVVMVFLEAAEEQKQQLLAQELVVQVEALFLEAAEDQIPP